MRTYARTARAISVRTGMRAVYISIAALATFGVVLPLAGCGSGNGVLKPASGSTVTRKKGTVSFTVVWPARTRLIPDAANSIQVTLTRVPDADIPNPKAVAPILFTRPPDIVGSSPNTTTDTKTFNNLELGDYTITAVAYPGTTGPGTPDPVFGTNVPVAKTAGTVHVDPGTKNVGLTMESTIAQLVPDLDPSFPRDASGNLILRPGQQVKFDINAFDNTPPTATPPGPYRVLFSKSKLQYSVVSQTGVTVTVDNTGLVNAGNLTNGAVGGSAVIQVTDTESGKSSQITVVVNPAGLSQVAQWSKFHGDSQNTGQVIAAGTVPVLDPNLRGVSVGLNWPLITGSQIDFSSPTIAQDGTVYIGTITKDTGASPGDKKLYAINKDGTLKWTFDDGGAMGDIEGSPTIAQDGTIFIGSLNGSVYALKDVPDAAKGTPFTLLWKKVVVNDGQGSGINASVAIGTDNTVYVATTAPDSKVYAFSGYTGQAIQAKQPDGTFKPWVFTEATGGIMGAPALSLEDGGGPETTLLVASFDGSVYAVGTGAAGTFGGSRIWRANVNGGNIIAAPTVTRIGTVKSVIVATLGGKVFALRQDSGATTNGWPSAGYDAGAPIYTTPAVREDNAGNKAASTAKYIYIATFDNTSGTDDHKVVALNAADGTQKWRTPVGRFTNGFTSSPALSQDGNYLYIGNYDGSLYAVDATDDNLAEHDLATFKDGGTLTPWIFATPNDGTQPINNLDSSPAVDKQGHVYIGGHDGSVYSVGINPAK